MMKVNERKGKEDGKEKETLGACSQSPETNATAFIFVSFEANQYSRPTERNKMRAALAGALAERVEKVASTYGTSCKNVFLVVRFLASARAQRKRERESKIARK